MGCSVGSRGDVPGERKPIIDDDDDDGGGGDLFHCSLKSRAFLH
jgi:hypothetical protein